MKLRALIACECSGRVRRALRARGWDVVSVDMQPAEDNGEGHVVGDVVPFLAMRWDMVIAHPPCTYLANSGVRWRVERGEWEQIRRGAEFFLACYHANAPRVAVENPVMHKYGLAAIGGKRHSFSVQPWQFGDDTRKRTCFWTRGLPPLLPTSTLDGSTARADVHREPPGPNRQRNRSRTPQGIADAIADQWGVPDLLSFMDAS